MDYFKIMRDFKKASIKSVPFLCSESGMGKTTFVQQYAETENLQLITMNLAAVESCDITGVPYKDNKGVMQYAKPYFLSMKKGILFFDEFNRITDNDVKSAMLSLIIDRSINGHKLSEDVQIITAGNPDSSDYSVEQFDKALEGRVVAINFSYTLDAFFDYIPHKTSFIDFLIDNLQITRELIRRRIEECNNIYHITNDTTYIGLFFGTETKRLFENYLKKNLFSLNDILIGKKSVDSISIQSAINDLVIFIMANTLNSEQSKNINAFLLSIAAENKLVFFQKMKKEFAKLQEKELSNKIVELKKSDVFKDLTKYLKELYS